MAKASASSAPTLRTTRSLAPLGNALVLTFILGLAAYTRLSRLDLVEFGYDEAMVTNLAQSFLEGKTLPLASIMSSGGITNPPLFVYLMALPLAFSSSAAVATGFLGLLNVGAVYLCYHLGRHYFGKRVGQVASLLLAASPWASYFSRRIQAQDTLILLASLFILFLFRFAWKGRQRDLVGMLLTLTATIQLHLAGLALMPVALVALLLFRDRVKARGLLVGLGLAAASFIPYGLWQWGQGGAEIRLLLERVPRAAGDGEPAFKSLDMVGGLVYGYLTPAVADFLDDRLRDGLWWGEVGLFVLSLGYLAWGVVRDRAQRVRLGLLLLWGVLPVLFFSWRSFDFYPHYLLVIFPMPYLALGLLLSRWEGLAWGTLSGSRGPASRWLARGAWAGGMLLLAGAVLVQTLALGRFIALVEAGAIAPEYGVPLRHLEATVERAAALGQARNEPVYVVVRNRDLREAFRFLGHSRGLRAIDSGLGLLLPPAGTQALYLLPEGRREADSPARRLLETDMARATLHQEGNLPFYLLSSRVETVDQWPALGIIAPGMEVRGGLIPQRLRAGESAPLAISWRAGEAPRPLTLFTHLVDGRGAVWGGQDQGAHPAAWQDGDRVVSWVEFPVQAEAPTGAYWLEMGVYPSGQPVRLPWYDSTGQPWGDVVRLGPIKVVSSDWPPPPPQPQHPRQADFGGTIRFLGYDRHQSADQLRLTLHWMALQKTDTDYTVFVHLVDETGRLVVQKDGQPRDGGYPTSLWDTGEFIADEVSLSLPPSLPAGSYRLYLGLYRLEDMAPLPLPEGADRLDLGVAELP